MSENNPSPFMSTAIARIRLEVGRDGSIRRRETSDELDPVLPQTIPRSSGEFTRGENLENTSRFDVVIPGRPNGRGAQLQWTTDNGRLETVSVISLGTGYGKPFTEVIEVPPVLPDDFEFVFRRAQFSVQADVNGRILPASLNTVTSGIGYVRPITLDIPGSSGELGQVRITPDADGNVGSQESIVIEVGSGYGEPLQFVDRAFPPPPGSSDILSVITVSGDQEDELAGLSLVFTLSRTSTLSAGTAATYDIVDVSLDSPGQGKWPSAFEIENFLFRARDENGSEVSIPLPQLRVEVEVDSEGAVTSASLTQTVIIDPILVNYGPSSAVTFPGSGDLQSSPELVDGSPTQTRVRAPDPDSVVIQSALGYIDGLYVVEDGLGSQWEATVQDQQIVSLALVSAGPASYPEETSLTLSQLNGDPIPRITASRAFFRVTSNSQGQLVDPVIIQQAGSGYTDGTYLFTDTNFNTGRDAVIEYTVVGESVFSARVTQGGTGYSGTRVITWTDNDTVPEENENTRIVTALIEVGVDERGEVVSANLVSGRRGRNYPQAGVVDLGPPGVSEVTLNGGRGARIRYEIRDDGSLDSVLVMSGGENYLAPERIAVPVSATTVLSRNYTFTFNDLPVTFPARFIYSLQDIAGYIEEAQLPGITAVVTGVTNPQLLLRSEEVGTLTIDGDPRFTPLWVEETGLDWFGTRNFEIRARTTPIRIDIIDASGSPVTIFIPSGAGLSEIIALINDARLDGVLAREVDGRLSIVSTFNKDFSVITSSRWDRDISTPKNLGYEPTQVTRQINSGTAPPGVAYQPGLVLFNRRILGTESSTLQRTFKFRFPGNSQRRRFRIGPYLRVNSVTVDGVRVEFRSVDRDPGFREQGIVELTSAFAPEIGREIVITAVFNSDDDLRYLKGRVLIQDPSQENNYALFEYDLVSRRGPEEWYYVISRDGEPVPDNLFSEGDLLPQGVINTAVFVNLRFDDEEHAEANRKLFDVIESDRRKYWLDRNADDLRAVIDVETSQTSRLEEPLLVSEYFRNGFVYGADNLQTIVQLPVYDPFKALLPGPADRNITYMTETDPARYTVSEDPSKVDPSQAFGRDHVGELWWDLTTLAYYWYEQGSNSYRRDNWGKLVPGSEISIYEWTRSPLPPGQYTGDGTPRSITDYVVMRELDPVTNAVQSFYYFWVRNPIRLPKESSRARTLSASEVSRLLARPGEQNFRWFAPVSQTSFLFSGIDRTFADSDNVFQINYTRAGTDVRPHVEWNLGSKDDPFYQPPEFYWERITDSLSEISRELSQEQDSDLGASLANYAPDQTIEIDGSTHLLVPDPRLNEVRRYGANVRPRQILFKDTRGARRLFRELTNQLLSGIRLRDENAGWALDYDIADLWKWTDWWAPGRNAVNSVPVSRVTVLAELSSLESVHNGDVILVTGLGLNSLSSLYEYDAFNQRFVLIYRQATRAEILPIVEELSTPELKKGLRGLIKALRQQVFVDSLLAAAKEIFFAMLNYAHSEQENIDWAFKTSYVSVRQRGRPMRQDALITNDVALSTIRYLQEAKPYHTKIRDYLQVRSPATERVDIKMQEVTRDYRIRMQYDRLKCSLSVVDIRIARSFGRSFSGYANLNLVEKFNGDGVTTQYQTAFDQPPPEQIRVTIGDTVLTEDQYLVENTPQGTIVTLVDPVSPNRGLEIRYIGAVKVRLGAAGRAAARLSRETGRIPLIESRDYQDFFTSTLQPSDRELDAIAEINQEILREMRCPLRGVLYDAWPLNGRIPWDVLRWDERDWDGSIEGAGAQLEAFGSQGPLFALRVNQSSADYDGRFTAGQSYSVGEQIRLAASVRVTVASVDPDGGVTDFVVTQAGSGAELDNALTQTITSGSGIGFSITPTEPNATVLFQDAEPLLTFHGNGLQREFELNTVYPDYMLEVFVNSQLRTRNVDYFVFNGSLVFRIPPAFGALVHVFTFVDAGTLLNPQVENGITQETVPLRFTSSLSVNVDRVLPPPTANATHVGGLCRATVGDQCSIQGQLIASVTTAGETTPPYTYEWQHVSGEILLQGTEISVSTFDPTLVVPTELTLASTEVGDQARTSVYELTITDSSGLILTDTGVGEYVVRSSAPPLGVVQTACATVPPQSESCSGGVGIFQVGGPVLDIPGGVGPFSTTVSLFSVTHSDENLVLTQSSYNQANNISVVSWQVADGSSATSGTGTLTAVYAVNSRDNGTGLVELSSATCSVNTSWACSPGDNPEPPPLPPENYQLTVRINSQTLSEADGFLITRNGVAVPAGGLFVTQGSTVTLTITQTDSTWDLTSLGGCGGTTSGTGPWTYTLVMPGSNCTVDLISTRNITASVVGTHSGGSCTVSVPGTCSAPGVITAQIINPELTTPPYAYTWSRVRGDGLDGDPLTLVSSQTSVSRTTSITRTSLAPGEIQVTSGYSLTVVDSAGQILVEDIPDTVYTFVGQS